MCDNIGKLEDFQQQQLFQILDNKNVECSKSTLPQDDGKHAMFVLCDMERLLKENPTVAREVYDKFMEFIRENRERKNVRENLVGDVDRTRILEHPTQENGST